MIEPTLFVAVWATVSALIVAALLVRAAITDEIGNFVCGVILALILAMSGDSCAHFFEKRWDAAHPQHEVRR